MYLYNVFDNTLNVGILSMYMEIANSFSKPTWHKRGSNNFPAGLWPV